ncbi:MAG TPA: hypothetical protein VF338_09015 [Leptolinea sp.]
MKFPNRLLFDCLIIVMTAGMLAGCSNNNQFETVPQTLAAMTQKAMSISVATKTPGPTGTATQTAIPAETATATVAPPLDYTDFTKVTPAPAQVNVAMWNNVNFKFVKSEISEVTRPLDPHSTTGKEMKNGKGKKTANLYFMADVNELYKKVISTSTFVSVTFSDGKEDIVYEGWESKGGALKGFYASEKTDTIGEVDFAFAIPKEGMEIVRLEIAENKNLKDKAVVLYQK